METKPINFFIEDTPENRELMNQALDEHMARFKSPSFYSYSLPIKKDGDELQIH